MSYKVGDIVLCEIETRSSGYKYVLSRYIEDDSKLETKELQIIRKFYEGSNLIYTVIIQDDLTGWTVNQFHVDYHDIASAHKGKKFWELTEEFILKKVK